MVLEAFPDLMAEQGFTPAETTVVKLLLEGPVSYTHLRAHET